MGGGGWGTGHFTDLRRGGLGKKERGGVFEEEGLISQCTLRAFFEKI